MLYVVTGGSASGKSKYAESLACGLSEGGRHFYVATMASRDIESLERIKKHRLARDGKGFITIEKPRNIGEICEIISEKDAVLVEDLSNLLANELFDGEFGTDFFEKGERICQKIYGELEKIAKNCGDCIIVANEIFNDDLTSVEFEAHKTADDMTLVYIKLLGELVSKLGLLSDHLIEIVCGIEVYIK